MTEESKNSGAESAEDDADRIATQKGEPPRTPGSAEGDRETVEEALREREGDDEA